MSRLVSLMRCMTLSLIMLFQVPTNAFAQGLPDVGGSITQADQIDEIIRQQQRLQRNNSGRPNAIDGEAGVFVLRVNDIYSVSGSSEFGYSSNPLRNVDDIGGSFLTNVALAASIQTLIDESFDFGLSLSVTGTDYNEAFAPSSRSASVSANIGKSLGNTPFYLSGNMFGGYSFDEDFSGSVGFWGMSTALSSGFKLGNKTIVRPSFGITAQWSETRENNSYSASLSTTVVHSVSPRFSISADVRASRTVFDDFYEDVTFVERNDWTYAGSLRADFVVNNAFSIGASAGYEQRESSFFLSNYKASEGSFAITGRIRF